MRRVWLGLASELALAVSVALSGCLPSGPRAPDDECPAAGNQFPTYPGMQRDETRTIVTSLDPGQNSFSEVYRVNVRFGDVVAFYRHCLAGREYPWKRAGRVSFRLDAPPHAERVGDVVSHFLVIERDSGGTLIRHACDGCY